jgi:Spy/CpxP family protein refolding chaperone
MKSRVALIAAALLASTVALAQAHDRPRGPDMDRMAVLLDLNDAQKTQVQQILDEQHAKAKAAHEERRSAGTKPTREERQKFHEELKQDTATRLQSVLSADQLKKFDVLMERPRKHHGHDGDRARDEVK